MKRIISGIAVVAMCALSTLAGAPATAASGASTCQLVGSATFTPNGPGSLATFGYSLAGSLSGCVATRDGAPAEGAIAVGGQFTRSVLVTLADGTITSGTATYQTPLATGAGVLPGNSCAVGTTAGTGVVTWSDGTTTVVDYGTTSAAAAVALQGAVVESVTATLVAGSVQPAGSAPATDVISSTNPVFPVGDTALGLVAFTTEDPTGCTTEGGLPSVDVEGEVGLGSAD